jgi:hypothetical protein
VFTAAQDRLPVEITLKSPRMHTAQACARVLSTESVMNLYIDIIDNNVQ